jgi:hypothetical protein
MDIRLDFPLDADHFLRRECSSCSQEFKWHHGATANRPADAVDPSRYACPLCGKQANHDEWFTQDQLRYREETVEFYAMDAVNDEMKKAFGKDYTPGKSIAPAPTPLHESTDMIIIESPCHPWEPVKVPQQRADSAPLYCLVCGDEFSA